MNTFCTPYTRLNSKDFSKFYILILANNLVNIIIVILQQRKPTNCGWSYFVEITEAIIHTTGKKIQPRTLNIILMELFEQAAPTLCNSRTEKKKKMKTKASLVLNANMHKAEFS